MFVAHAMFPVCVFNSAQPLTLARSRRRLPAMLQAGSILVLLVIRLYLDNL